MIVGEDYMVGKVHMKGYKVHFTDVFGAEKTKRGKASKSLLKGV